MALTIKKGDAYPIPMVVKLNGQVIDDGTIYSVQIVEFQLQDLRKEWRADGTGEVTYENGVFWFPISQSESFAFRAGKIKLDTRVKTINGWVQGAPDMHSVAVQAAASRKEL